MWAFVDNDNNFEIFAALPENWRNISNFSSLKSNKQRLQQLGWYEIVDDSTPITNSFLQYHDAPTYTLDHRLGVVRKKCEIIFYSPAPSLDELFQAQRVSFFANLRQQRDRLLSETDWTQLADLQKTTSESWKQQWQDYRQSLRDLPALYETDTYSKVVDINQVLWPLKPVNQKPS